MSSNQHYIVPIEELREELIGLMPVVLPIGLMDIIAHERSNANFTLTSTSIDNNRYFCTMNKTAQIEFKLGFWWLANEGSNRTIKVKAGNYIDGAAFAWNIANNIDLVMPAANALTYKVVTLFTTNVTRYDQIYIMIDRNSAPGQSLQTFSVWGVEV